MTLPARTFDAEVGDVSNDLSTKGPAAIKADLLMLDRRTAGTISITDAAYGASTSASAATNTTAIHLAIADMTAGMTLYVPPGDYDINNVVFDAPSYCGLKMDGRFIGASATGTALTIGTNGAQITNYRLDRIYVRSNVYSADAGRVGVQLRNIDHYSLSIVGIFGFEKGLEIAPYGTVTSYCSYGSIDCKQGEIYNNKYCLYMAPQAGSTGAWSTEIVFDRFSAGVSSAGYTALGGNAAGATLVYIGSSNVGSITFRPVRMECYDVVVLADIGGSSIIMDDCYLEQTPTNLTSAATRIQLNANSSRCLVDVRSTLINGAEATFVTDVGEQNEVRVRTDNSRRPVRWHVSDTGSDSNSGLTEQEPLLTRASAEAKARRGDEILFRRGSVFAETITWDNAYNGVIYGSYGDQALPKPLFTALSVPQTTASYVHVRDLAFSNGAGSGITLSNLYGTSTVLIDGCDAYACLVYGIDAQFHSANTGGAYTIRNMKAWGCGSGGGNFTGTPGTSQVLVVDGFETYENYRGVRLGGSGTGSAAYSNILAYRNTNVGIYIATGTGGKLYNSTSAYNASYGFYNDGATRTGWDIQNCIFAFNTTYQFRISAGAEASLTLNYNCYHKAAGDVIGYNGVDYNALATFQAASGQEANGLFSNPLFASSGSNDYALLSGSPGIDAGATIAAVTADRNGTKRPVGAGYNMGAFESHLTDSFLPRTTAVNLGTVGATGDYFTFSPNSTTIVTGVSLVSDAGVAIHGTDYWSAQLRNLTKAVNLLSAVKTTFTGGTAITADTPWTMTPNQNTIMSSGDVMEIQFTKTNAPADLTKCTIFVHVRAAE